MIGGFKSEPTLQLNTSKNRRESHLSPARGGGSVLQDGFVFKATAAFNIRLTYLVCIDLGGNNISIAK
jgi:hypothetical protein